jgi:lipoprotein-anchoring transpeptidase ErfK/SrfK
LSRQDWLDQFFSAWHRLEFIVPRVLHSLFASFACAMTLVVGASSASANAPFQRPINEPPLPPSKVQSVSVPAVYAPGSIVIVNNERKLYYITAKGQALRYGVAVGKNSELWMGRTFVAAKAHDPKWIPVNGDEPVEGGDPKNPLGKRAMYLDWSLLRIHGTPSRGSIGSATSNGCIRMLNEDVVDLFERVHLGAPVYAIKSWKEATKYESVRVAEKIYADPEAHKEAQEELKEQLAELALQKAEEAKRERLAGRASPSSNQSRPRPPQSWGNPYALGR